MKTFHYNQLKKILLSMTMINSLAHAELQANSLATIDQIGSNRDAFIHQTGEQQLASIQQVSSGAIMQQSPALKDSVEIIQAGYRQHANVYDLGEQNQTQLTQSQSANQAEVSIEGSSNSLELEQKGVNQFLQTQVMGDFNQLQAIQAGDSNIASLAVLGNDNRLMLMQNGSGDSADVHVNGSSNAVDVTQSGDNLNFSLELNGNNKNIAVTQNGS